MINYIAPLNKNIQRDHVRFYNRYGLAIAGDLHYKKDIDKNQKYSAFSLRRLLGHSQLLLHSEYGFD